MKEFGRCLQFCVCYRLLSSEVLKCFCQWFWTERHTCSIFVYIVFVFLEGGRRNTYKGTQSKKKINTVCNGKEKVVDIYFNSLIESGFGEKKDMSRELVMWKSPKGCNIHQTLFFFYQTLIKYIRSRRSERRHTERWGDLKSKPLHVNELCNIRIGNWPLRTKDWQFNYLMVGQWVL